MWRYRTFYNRGRQLSLILIFEIAFLIQSLSKCGCPKGMFQKIAVLE